MRGESKTFLIAVLSVCLVAGCSFNLHYDISLIPPADTPIATPTEGTVNMVYEDPGTIVVFHGYACAESDRNGQQVRLRLRQELKLPSYAVSATVLLNGWRTKYLHDDHHFAGFGTAIYSISRARDTLTWEASGDLSDDNFDDAYGWCYRYTVIGWNPAGLSAVVDHADPDHIMLNENRDNTTALKDLRGVLPVGGLPARAPIAILPRGYGVSYDTPTDHHLLQLAYNLDYSEKFAEHDKKYAQLSGISCGPGPCMFTNPSFPTAANYAEGFVTWDSKTIFKDNDLRRNYENGELVSALGGADVGVMQPPFTLLPREDTGLFNTCVGDSPVTHDVVTEEVPFEYAVPMLTGWELAYGCDDHHVRDMGAWIDRFSYTRPSGGAGGTLRHTVSTLLRDNDGNSAAYTFRVHILGFKRIGSTGTTAPATAQTASPTKK